MSGYQKLDELDLLLGRPPIVWEGGASQQQQQPLDAIMSDNNSSISNNSNTNKKISAIPPKIVIHLFNHEEVTTLKTNQGGTSDVMIDGTTHVKLISSDASNNIPFQLIASSLQLGNVMLTYNKAVTVRDDMNNTTFVKIPKSLKGKIQIANYRLVMENEIMPFVVERKLIRIGGKDIKKYALFIKIQSKLSPHSDDSPSITNLTAAIAIPPTVVASTIEVKDENNHQPTKTSIDELRRILKWNIPVLNVNHDSIEIQVMFEVISGIDDVSLDEQKFPILLRCESTDCNMSDVSLSVSLSHSDTIKGASIIQHKSFTLWYRVN